MSKNSRPTEDRSFHALLGTIAVCLLAVLAIGGFKGHRDLQRARIRELAIETKISEADLEVQRLENRIRALRDDPTSLERMAREQFNMVLPTDVVIVLSPRVEAGMENRVIAGDSL